MSKPLDFHTLLSDLIDGDLAEPTNSIWLVYAAAIIETIAPARRVAELWEYITSKVNDDEKRLRIARRLREGLLKSSPLAGFPRGINALAAFRKSLSDISPTISSTYEADKSLRSDHSAAELEARGKLFFDRVYGKMAARVQESMALSSGGDLDQFAILGIYGELMAEERILDAKETGLLEFLVCFVSGAVPQAKGHMYGSRNLGNGKVEVLRTIRLARDMSEALGVRLDEEGMEFVEKVESW